MNLHSTLLNEDETLDLAADAPRLIDLILGSVDLFDLFSEPESDPDEESIAPVCAFPVPCLV